MDNRILTKEEYTQKLDNLLKPAAEFAMGTKQFNEMGCYVEEFVEVGGKEVTLMVMDKSWVAIPIDIYNDLTKYRSLYNSIITEYEELKKNTRKKFLGIF